MLEFIVAFLETVWPRLSVCLLCGTMSSFVALMFDMAWWKKIILGIALFFGWIFVGIVLEIIHARKETRMGGSVPKRFNEVN